MERRTFEVKLERTEWIRLNYNLFYKNKMMLWLTFIGIIMLGTVLNYWLGNSFGQETFPFIQLAFAIFCLVILPIVTYTNSSRLIKTNPWVSEKATYEIDSAQLSVKGNSYDVKVDWSTVKSIMELKNWFIIFTDQNRGCFIPKRIFASEGEIASFRNVLKSAPVNDKKFQKPVSRN